MARSGEFVTQDNMGLPHELYFSGMRIFMDHAMSSIFLIDPWEPLKFYIWLRIFFCGSCLYPCIYCSRSTWKKVKRWSKPGIRYAHKSLRLNFWGGYFAFIHYMTNIKCYCNILYYENEFNIFNLLSILGHPVSIYMDSMVPLKLYRWYNITLC